MAEPNKSESDRDVELDNDSDGDEDVESVDGSSSSSTNGDDDENDNSDEESSPPASNSEDSDEDSATSSDSDQSDCLSDVWSDEEAKKDGDLIPEAQEAQLRTNFENLLLTEGVYSTEKILDSLMTLNDSPILAKYKLEFIGDYDWKDAAEKAKFEKIANNGQLYCAINKKIAELFVDLEEHQKATNHFLQALSIHPDDSELWWQCALSAAKIANWNFSRFSISMTGSSIQTVKLLAIVQFYTDQFEDCLRSLSMILDYDSLADDDSRKFAIVLKDEIVALGEPFQKMAESVFAENENEDLSKWKFVDVSQEKRSVIKAQISTFHRPYDPSALELKPQFAPSEVEISRKMKVEDFGVLLCDLFDRMEAFSNINLQKIRLLSSDQTVERKLQPAVRPNADSDVSDCVNNLLDIVCCLDGMTLEVSEDKVKPVKVKPAKPKQKPKYLSQLAIYQRRSTRYIEQEENAGDECNSDVRLLECLDISEELAESRISKYELRRTKRQGDIVSGNAATSHEPPLHESSEAFIGEFCTDSTKEYAIEILLRRFLTFMISKESEITGFLKEVFIGAYLRWILFYSGNNSKEANAYVEIHLAAAELHCTEALHFCNAVFEGATFTDKNWVRFKWLILDRCDVETRDSLLLEIEEILKSSEGSLKSTDVYSFTPGRHAITAEVAATERMEMLRKSQLEELDAFIDASKHQEVIDLLELHYNWDKGDIEDVMRNSLTLINSYSKLGNKDKVVEWTLRIIQAFVNRTFTDDERLATLLESLTIDSTIDEVLLHDLAYHLYLLRETNKFIRLPAYWLRLYETAKALEGGITMDVVKRHMKRSEEEEYPSEETLPTRALSVLQIAHEKLGEVSCCGRDKGSFLLYYLTELNNVLSVWSIRQLFFSRHSQKGLHDVAATFSEEFNQLLFCYLTHTGKRAKMVCEDHHARCDIEPSWKEAVIIIPILFREKLHMFDDKLKIPQESIDIILKNFAFIWEEPCKEAEDKFNEFLAVGVVGKWPRAMPEDPEKDRVRSTVFYALALHYYQAMIPKKAAAFSKRFLVCAYKESCWTASAWAIFAHMHSSRLLEEKDDELLLRDAEKTVFAFEMGFSVDDGIAITHFELADTAYQLRTRISRYIPSLGRTLKRANAIRLIEKLLHTCRKHVNRANDLNNGEREPEQDIEWLYCYFNGKVAEKFEEPAEKVLSWYYQCAKILERQGYQYSLKISKKKQENLEPVEIHYRIYSYIWKRLSNADEVPDLYDMNLMTVYAEHFENHGVTRRFLACRGSDEAFEQEPDIRAVLNELTHKASLRRPCTADPEVYAVVSDMVERVHLRERCLSLCESNFALVVSRYPFHYKAHYRIAEMEQQQGHYKKAIVYLFQKVFKKRNPYVSIYENCISVHRRDIERSGSFEFHMDRLMELSLYCCFKANDLEKMFSLLYSLGLAAYTPGVLNENKRKERITLARTLIVTLVKRNEGNVLKLTNREKETFLKTAMVFSDKAKANCDELTHKMFAYIVKHISEATRKHREQAANRARQQAMAKRIVHQHQHISQSQHLLNPIAAAAQGQDPSFMFLASLLQQQALQQFAQSAENRSSMDLTNLLKRSSSLQSDSPPNKISKQQ